MHVLLIHQALGTPASGGGTRHIELTGRVVSEGHNATIVTSDLHYATGQRVTGSSGEVEGEEVINGVRVLRARTLNSLHRSFVWRVVSFVSFMLSSFLLALRVGHVDVVMGTSPPLFQAVSAWLVSAVRRKPFLLEIRDLWPEFAIDMGVLKDPLLIRLSRWLESFLYARATRLLVNSPAYRDYLIAKGQPAGKISFIANGVDVDQFTVQTDGDSYRHANGLDGAFVLTYAGALGIANDLTTLLRAAKLVSDIPNIRFLLVGDGKERAALEAFAVANNVSNVVFCGMQSKADMPKILDASDICVAILQNIPMFRTTYPNKVFDYMAAARPVLLAIDGVIRDVVESSDCGVFVSPGDPVALAAAIRRLYEMPEASRRAMGMRGRLHVTRHFNRHQQAAEFSQLLQQMVRQ